MSSHRIAFDRPIGVLRLESRKGGGRITFVYMCEDVR
jgi:hypothetical protein